MRFEVQYHPFFILLTYVIQRTKLYVKKYQYLNSFEVFSILYPQVIMKIYEVVMVRHTQADLNWAPEFDLLDGLKDSYSKDFGRGTFRKAANFATDDMILAKLKGYARA
jgi:hypothetical protein